jgi:digalactosyldiacylglycerol synthase
MTSLLVQFSRDKRSILPVGDISEIIPDEEADIAVLEEPDLTWYHHGKRWKVKFRLVIGIIHTNYLEYVKREKNGRMKALLLKYGNSWVVGIYCHKVWFL